MMSGGAEPSSSASGPGLPGISVTKTSLVEAVGSNTSPSGDPTAAEGGRAARSKPRGGTPPLLLQTRRNGSPQATAPSLRAAVTAPLYLPRPPSAPPSETRTPRRVPEYVRLARSELNDKEQAMSGLRSENMKLKSAVRELKNYQESHSALQSVCSDLAQCMGCSSIEGVAAESVREILHTQVSSLLQDRKQALEQLRRLQNELESSRSETAAASVRVTNLETQLHQTRGTLASRDSDIQRLQAEVERLQGSEAKSTSVLQSLRQRLTELEGERGGEEAGKRLLELQTEIGRLKKTLHEKEESQQGVQSQLEASQEEVEDMRQRVNSMEEMHEDLCSQLTEALHLEESASHSTDTLVTEVGRLAEECPHLRLRVDTLTKTLNACELDSRASRETILRLVSEVKKHEKLALELSELQQASMEQETVLEGLERERDGYQERLVAAKETMAAQEEELQAKEARMKELVSSWHSLKATADAESELTASEQEKYRELCSAVGSLIGSSSTDTVELLQTLEQIVQGGHEVKQRLEEREAEQVERGRAQSSLQTQLTQSQEELKRERVRVRQLEGELLTQTAVREGLERDTENERQFYQRLSRTLKLDPPTAQVLTGDFVRDAILAKAEQMAKHETQSLAEKQSALYSAQRQLKTCRQTLESKEMYLGLLQKKARSLEERVQEMGQREAHLETLASKGKRYEKQAERLRAKVTEQAEELDRLRADTRDMASLKTQCEERETELGRLLLRIEELNEARAEQARQLAEARARAQSSAVARERREEARQEEGRKRELTQLQEQLSRAREKEKKFGTFQEAVHQLLSDIRPDGQEGAPGDYDLIAQLEQLVAEHKELRDTVKCLGSSLQQLEQGFRSGYSDTLAILHTKA